MISKEDSFIDDELIYINRNINQLSLVDRFIFLVNRLYKNFYEGLHEARKIDGVLDHTYDDDIEIKGFLNKYGHFRIKKEILKLINEKEILGNLIDQFYDDKLKHLSSKKNSFLNNKEHILIAPFIYNISEIKRTLIHEFSLVSKNELEYHIKNISSIFKELILRISQDYSWDAYNEDYRKYEIENVFYWNAYQERWEDSGFPNQSQIEIAKLLGVNYRTTIDLKELILWVENIDIKKIESVSKKQKLSNSHEKLVYQRSPVKLKTLFVQFFSNHGLEVNSKQESMITRFIINCFKTDNKNYSIGSSSYESINFFDKKTVIPFIALLVYLNKKDLLKIQSSSKLSALLISELKTINKGYIGFSNNLRDIISQKLMTKTENDLSKLAGFKNPIDINRFIKN